MCVLMCVLMCVCMVVYIMHVHCMCRFVCVTMFAQLYLLLVNLV